MGCSVVMIHGMWGGPWCGAGYRALFEAAGRPCVVPALSFHDRDTASSADLATSVDPHLAGMSLLDYADGLARQITALGERPVLVGHSMGGLLAQMLAARGLARAVVLLAPAAPAGVWAIGPSVICGFRGVLTIWGFWRRAVRPGFAEVAHSMLQRVSAAEQRAIYERFVPESGRIVFEIGFWMFDVRRVARVDPARVTCPVLVVAGREDRITPAWALRHVARRYRADYREYADHGHRLIGEPGWQEIVADVLAWLDEVAPLPASEIVRETR